jgi:hypothetical protein
VDLKEFFQAVLPTGDGWTPVILKGPMGGLTNFRWFQLPGELDKMAAYVQQHADLDVYYSPFLYTQPPARNNTRHAAKANVIRAACVWADGDDCPLDKLRIQPTITVRTSRNHWQGYWLFTDREDYDNETLEALSRGLYEAHADDGMDRGWPLSKKLRVPFTANLKRTEPWDITLAVNDEPLTTAEFAAEYAPVERQDTVEEDMPTDIPSMFDVLGTVNRSFITDLATDDMFTDEDDRSAKMYHLQCALWEEGCSIVEAFAVVRETAFNKFALDGRGDTYLWKQINRDRAKWEQEHNGPTEGELESSTRLGSSYLMSEARELEWQELSFLHEGEIEPDGTFVDQFALWAATKSAMAPRQFHYAGALAILSSMFAKYAYLPINVQKMPLNLYFLVLGRTTQSRKSTSLRLAELYMRDVAVGIGKGLDAFIAPEDSTGEALAAYLRTKHGESGIFAIDEVQDFFAQASTKGSYMTSMMPFLTKSYDGFIPALARKDKGGKVAYQSQVPYYLTFYGTGILDQAAKHLTSERVESGFTPRCLVIVDDRDHYITSSQDVKLVPVNASTGEVEDKMRTYILTNLAKAVRAFDTAYTARRARTLEGEEARTPVMFEPSVFDRWITFSEEAKVLAAQHGLNSRELFPGTERLTFSVLRIAALLAMYQGPAKDGAVRVSMRHMLKAIALAPIWMASNEVFIHHVKNSNFSHKVDSLINYVAKSNNSIVSIPKLMLKFQSNISGMRELKEIISYAQARGVIQEVIKGKSNNERFIKYTGGRV